MSASALAFEFSNRIIRFVEKALIFPRINYGKNGLGPPM